MVNVPWPAVLQPRDFGYFHVDADSSGGQALGGGEQVVASPGSRWGASMTLGLFNDERVLAARALRAQLKGRANPTLLPNFDGRRLSWPTDPLTGRMITPKVAHILRGTYGRGTAPVVQDTIYAGSPPFPGVPLAAQIVATVAPNPVDWTFPGDTPIPGSWPIHATTIAINMTQGGPFRPGQQFGLLNFRIYEIAKIVSVVGSVTTVDFIPPLRSIVEAGAEVQVTRPVCLMRCLNLNEQMKKLEFMRYATLNLEFEEYYSVSPVSE